jgi:hypothetical protein
MKILFSLLLLAAPAFAFADGLSELRATLLKLRSDQPLRARIEVKTRRKGGESDQQSQAQGTTTVIAESGPQGLQLGWSPEQIRQARQTAREDAANPDAPHAGISALTALDAEKALNLLDDAETLSTFLEKSVLLEDKPDSYQGKPARLLVIRPDLHLDQEGRKALKSSELAFKIWLDGDGVPLAANSSVELKFSKFFISFRVSEHETREYQCAGGRLVVTRVSRDVSSGGLGHTEESHSATTVTLLPSDNH